jgi:hypothetical protein
MKTKSLRDELQEKIKNGEIKVTKEKVDLVGEMSAHKSLSLRLKQKEARRAEGARTAGDFRVR